MFTRRNVESNGKRRQGKLSHRGYRRLGVEQLEDRRLLSGTSALGTLAPVVSASAQTGQAAAASSAAVVGATSASAQLAAETTVGQSIDAFAEALYRQIQSQAGGSGNLFLSPASISTALAMTYAGAQGETATQMAAALHFTVDPDTMAADFGSLLADLNTAGGSNYSLSVADALWGQQGYPFLSSFLNLMQTDYGGGLHQVDFQDQAEAARQTINTWVASQTNNKIQNLIPEGALNSLTKLVLTNAIYFKGQWATPFNSMLTQNAAFTLGSGAQVQVPTMHATDFDSYMQNDGFQVLQLPYAGGRLAMDVLLPTSSGSAGLDVSQLPADLNRWLQAMTPQQVAISLPKFQITTPSIDLSQSLEALGMTDAFNPATADFSGIADDSADPLYISAVVHQAFVDVNEQGTEAAAATGVIVGATCIMEPITPPIVFDADHPFLFLIRDTQSGSILFMGQVADPTTTSTDPTAPAVPVAQPSAIASPSALQLTSSAAGLTNLNNSSPARAPTFKVSGLTPPPTGDTAQVILYADGIQIGQAAVTGTSVFVTANGVTKLSDGSHKITVVEKLTYPTSLGAASGTVFSPASGAATIQVGTAIPQFTSTPVTLATFGSTINYQVYTTAPANEQITYAIVTAPAGMTISPSGRVHWVAPTTTTSPQRVDIRVTDQFGNTANQIFSIQLVSSLLPTKWGFGTVGYSVTGPAAG